MKTPLYLLPFLCVFLQRVDELRRGIESIVNEHIAEAYGGAQTLLPLVNGDTEIRQILIRLISPQNCLEALNALMTEGLAVEEHGRFKITADGILAMTFLLRTLRTRDGTQRILIRRIMQHQTAGQN